MLGSPLIPLALLVVLKTGLDLFGHLREHAGLGARLPLRDAPVKAARLPPVVRGSRPALYLALTPDLEIVAVSEAYLRATRTQRAAIIGTGPVRRLPGRSRRKRPRVARPGARGTCRDTTNSPVLDDKGELAFIISSGRGPDGG